MIALFKYRVMVDWEREIHVIVHALLNWCESLAVCVVVEELEMEILSEVPPMSGILNEELRLIEAEKGVGVSFS